MRPAYDVYAETNPAFCSQGIVVFTKAYLSINPTGPELPSVYLALPVALSGDLADTFGGTNKNTGLLEWLERSPGAQVDLAKRVNASMEIVTEGVRFGCFAGTISLAKGAHLQLGGKKLKKAAIDVLDAAATQALKRAERLGYWFAMAGSTRNVFDIMGLTA